MPTTLAVGWAHQGLDWGSGLVAGKTTILRFSGHAQDLSPILDHAVIEILHPDGSLASQTVARQELVFLPPIAKWPGESVVLTIPGNQLPEVGLLRLQLKVRRREEKVNKHSLRRREP